MFSFRLAENILHISLLLICHRDAFYSIDALLKMNVLEVMCIVEYFYSKRAGAEDIKINIINALHHNSSLDYAEKVRMYEGISIK